MRVYISASWKQRDRVRALAIALREEGHNVYDFTDPACRQSPEIPPERFPIEFDPQLHNYREYLTAVPEWRQAVFCNLRAIQQCDVVVLLLPAGADSHADWAFGCGQMKITCVVGAPRFGERTPSHLWASAMLDTDAEVASWLSRVANQQGVGFVGSADPIRLCRTCCGHEGFPPKSHPGDQTVARTWCDTWQCPVNEDEFCSRWRGAAVVAGEGE